MVFITHDLRLASQVCDHLAVIQRGSIVEYGPTAQVLNAPQHTYTQSLINAIPSLGHRLPATSHAFSPAV